MLLVHGKSKKWGFPKGEVNGGEYTVHCAMREVMEETSFDKFNRIDSKVYLEEDVYEKTRLFLIPCVSENKTFNDIPRQNSSHQMAASTRNSN